MLKQIKANKLSIEECLKLIEEWKGEADKITELYKAVITGDFPKEFEDAIVLWLKENAADIVGELVHMIFFGLTDEGYFVAYVPYGWEDISFGTTGLDDFPTGVDYGHLTLTY